MKLIKQSVVLAFVLSLGTVVAAPAAISDRDGYGKENRRDSNTTSRHELESNSEAANNSDLQTNSDAGNENRLSNNRQLSGQNSDSSDRLSSSASGDASTGNGISENNVDPDLSTLMFERFKLY